MPLRERFSHNRARRDHRMVAQSNAREHHTVHPQPAFYPQGDVPPATATIRIMDIVVFRDEPNIRSDPGAPADEDIPTSRLKVATTVLEIIEVVWVKVNPLLTCDEGMARHGPTDVSVPPHDLLQKDAANNPTPTLCRPMGEPASLQVASVKTERSEQPGQGLKSDNPDGSEGMP